MLPIFIFWHGLWHITDGLVQVVVPRSALRKFDQPGSKTVGRIFPDVAFVLLSVYGGLYFGVIVFIAICRRQRQTLRLAFAPAARSAPLS